MDVETGKGSVVCTTSPRLEVSSSGAGHVALQLRTRDVGTQTVKRCSRLSYRVRRRYGYHVRRFARPRPACTEDCKPGRRSGCPIKARRQNGNLSCVEVHRLLRLMGVEHPLSTSSCVKAAIQRRFIKVTGDPADLDRVVFSGTLPDYFCNHQYDVRLRDILHQPDYAGLDYECGLEYATAVCPTCRAQKPDIDISTDYDVQIGRAYVSGLCRNRPEFDSGKFHNHCVVCPGFGVCIYDYRERHCPACQDHYFAGLRGNFRCRCGGYAPREDDSSLDDTDTEDSPGCPQM